MHFTKRKNKLYSGTMRLPNGYTISVNGEEVGTIQDTTGSLWFWYGAGHNTLSREKISGVSRTFQSPEEALEDFKKFYLAKTYERQSPS